MSTATKRTRPEANEATLADRIRAILAKHQPLVDAQDKLNALKMHLAKLQAELDQSNAAIETPVAELAQRVLSGDDLSTREVVYQKHVHLNKQVEAYQLAIRRQQEVVNGELANARAIVRLELLPEFLQRAKALVEAFAQCDQRIAELKELRDTISSTTGDYLFTYHELGRWETMLRHVNAGIEQHWRPLTDAK